MVILKNRRYAALHDFAPVFGFEPGAEVPGTDLPELDFVSLARGHGVKGVRVDDAASLGDALQRALAATEPMLVEVEIA